MGCWRRNLNPPRSRLRGARQRIFSAGTSFLRSARARLIRFGWRGMCPLTPNPSPPPRYLCTEAVAPRGGEGGRTALDNKTNLARPRQFTRAHRTMRAISGSPLDEGLVSPLPPPFDSALATQSPAGGEGSGVRGT